ncbi:hypothetical protein Cni_G25633 [Canna indica]|uniref:Uncharacterized protein n=1 Tax=Canna indica TaxID=4628 RepID=A0AAQ3QQL9_9LILI|nr:hypothetical protein Cni_G25633 [Canna indica]
MASASSASSRSSHEIHQDLIFAISFGDFVEGWEEIGAGASTASSFRGDRVPAGLINFSQRFSMCSRKTFFKLFSKNWFLYNQEQQESTVLNPAYNPFNQMDVHAKIRALNPPKEIDSFGEERTPRVRKSYTITKQRERWTEEEHKKFLEALQLYGRAWRRIEEHIGSKTVVQIRSHAQKFFSKVVRESDSNDSEGTLKAIEIPPPRPKRKPLHPYPRKLGNLSNKGSPVLKQLQRSPLQSSATCEQEDRSPTSVLSAFGSETPASTFSNGQNGCSSPVGSNDHDDGGDSPTITVQGDNKLPSFCEGAPGLTMQDHRAILMEIDPRPNTSSEAQVPTFKLFGKTVEVTTSNKSCAPSDWNVAQPNLMFSCDINSHQGNKAFDLHSKAEMSSSQSSTQGLAPWDISTNAWNAYPCLIPPWFYCFPVVGENSVGPMFLPLPWWTTHSNLPFPFVHPQAQHPQQFSTADVGDQGTAQREGSCTGSSTSSINRAGLSNQNTNGVVDSKSIEIEDEI